MITDSFPHRAIDDPLTRRFQAALRHRPRPLLIDGSGVIPGASIWTAARLWRERFHEIGLRSGDRVTLALPPGRAFLLSLLGAWRAGLTVCPLEPDDPETPADRAMELFDARAHVAGDAAAATIAPDPAGAPAARATASLRPAASPSTPDIAIILSTSGSGGPPKRIALSRDNVAAQLESHTRALGIGPGEVALSVLPWRHAFGLLVDALPTLLSGATVIVDRSFGRDVEAMRRTARDRRATRICMVPLQVRRWLGLPGGAVSLSALRGGVVGGAAVREDLAEALASTRLRAGYGLTEASPGVCLGRPGEWREGWLGSPIGCQTRIGDGGELLVRGPNVCVGRWDHRLYRERPDRWLATGDLVEPVGDGYVHRGRADHRFKLESGRMIDAPTIERRLRSALPGGADPVVTTADGRRLQLIVPPGCTETARRAWPDGLPVPDIIELALRREDLTPKGEPDRLALARNLMRRTEPAA